MRAGVWVLNVFAAVWGAGAMFGAGLPPWSWTGPVLISAGLIAQFQLSATARDERTADERRRVRKVVGIWSAVEGVAILVSVNLLSRFGDLRLVAPVIGVIVGAHFLPLARGLRLPLYYATGLAIIAVSLLAMTAPAPWPLVVTGAGAALILWASSLALAGRARLAPWLVRREP